MSYIDGFVIAVPTANKQKFIEHARLSDSIFTDLGATRVVECWADDVPEGKVTDFGKSVQAKADESVVDPHCRSHRWTNLYVADASVFPSSGGGESPSLTIEALGLRTAHAIGKRS